MNSILFTQRVDIIESYGERRDCADQNISRLIKMCGYVPVPMINDPELVRPLSDELKPVGILLTGGNDLGSYGGNAPERDITETRLLEYAVKKKIPLLGICRGMQFVANYYGAKLERVEGHIRKNHAIHGVINRNSVNSFHGMAVKNIVSPLEELARAEDGVIEALQHKENLIAGIMWHPERVEGFLEEDIDLIKHFYEEGRLI